jgi:hypothetical protein
VEILKRLKPDIRRDDIDQLLPIASGGARSEVVRYLLELGATPNDKSNSGSSALDNCLERFGFESFVHDFSFASYRSKAKASKYSVSETRATIQLLLEHGALWRPDGSDQVSRMRRSLLECEPDVTLELVEGMMKYSACTQDTIHELLRTPTMKKHVSPLARKFVPMGFDVRTTEQKAEDERQKNGFGNGRFRTSRRDTTAKRYIKRSGQNRSNTWRKDIKSPTLVLLRFVRG